MITLVFVRLSVPLSLRNVWRYPSKITIKYSGLLQGQKIQQLSVNYIASNFCPSTSSATFESSSSLLSPSYPRLGERPIKTIRPETRISPRGITVFEGNPDHAPT